MIKEDGTIVFEGAEQEKLNQIVEERLARERGKYSDYEDVKAIAEELKDFGYEGTPAEIRQMIKQQKEEMKAQQQYEQLQEQAQTEGTSPELLAKMKEMEETIKTLKGERDAQKEAERKKQEFDENWNKQVKEFTETYGNVDLDDLASNPKFVKFIKGRTGTLKEFYEDFVDFVGETEAEAIVKFKSKESRSTGGGKESSLGNNAGLSPAELKTLEEWNRRNPNLKMTASEYKKRL